MRYNSKIGQSRKIEEANFARISGKLQDNNQDLHN